MGCDIHIVVERRRKAGEPWMGLYTTDRLPGGRPKIAQRDYDFFGAVAGVRCRPEGFSNYPRNVPEDISQLAWQEYMRCPTDHHSASHMSAAEFCAIHHKVNPQISREEWAMADLLGIDGDDGEHRVVFWFDN
jgi:hypothetical protein